MSNGSRREPGVGLALSGGGFRATLFHLGSLWRLNELGWLPKLTVITSVSGGSIAAGVLAHRWKNLRFDNNGVAANFTDEMETPLRRFCARNIDVLAGLVGMLPGVSGGDVVAYRYKKYLFGDATLQDLPSGANIPRFLFYATSLQTGASVRITKEYLADYKVGQWPSPTLPLAMAVAASSAFPPVLSPLIIKTDASRWQDMPGTRFFGDERYRSRLILTDGGVYDNLGLEAIWDRYETVLVSDAGAPLAPDPGASGAWANLTVRVLDILTDQTRALRKRRLIEDFKSNVRHGTYWGITTHIDDYQLSDAITKDSDLTAALKEMRTRLNEFSAEEQGRLINWGYALTDAAMRKHVLNGGAPGRWPDPNHRL